MTDDMNGSFEDRLQQVENLIAGIEGGKLSLEDSVKSFTKALFWPEDWMDVYRFIP